jgi:N-formylglutamate deformylase
MNTAHPPFPPSEQSGQSGHGTHDTHHTAAHHTGHPPDQPPSFTLHQGHSPLLLSLPHVGTLLPSDQQHRYTAQALAVEDTDWHLDQLYAFAHALGASVITPRYSRYLIDLNRPSDNTPMYAGANNTGLCPLQSFSATPLYRPDCSPSAADIAQRTRSYWQPYHDALHSELQRLRQRHGHAVLFDAHSIRSELPWLFEGRLPDLNLGTVRGSSAAPSLRAALQTLLQNQSQFSHVVDGRFQGGYITRHYGQPQQHIHAVQLEMCWHCYMAETPPYALDPTRVRHIQPLLQQLLTTLRDWQPT